jgi:hypothetical protein
MANPRPRPGLDVELDALEALVGVGVGVVVGH